MKNNVNNTRCSDHSPVGNYVCLSDLHLGAKYSILSSRDEQGLYRAQGQSDCLRQLAAGLHQYVPRVFVDAEEKPVLILLGDLLDYSFGSMTDIAKAFEPFVEAFFPAGVDVFDKQIILIPGNHDHHLWQSVKDELFLQNFYRDKLPDGEIRYQTTELFHNDSLPSPFLNSLPIVKEKGLSFELRYPNWGLRLGGESDLNAARVLFHHGHYVENLYRLMTLVNQLISDIDDPDIEELEKQNGGWVEFFWSSLGASPVQRDNAVLLFDIMQDPGASHEYAQRLANIIADYLSAQYGISQSRNIFGKVSTEKLLTGLIDSTLGQGFQAERAHYHQVLSEDGLKGLQWYLSKSLLKQYTRETMLNNNAPIEPEISFVFGHTHKPFQDQIGIQGYQHPVKIYNSGGWVVDQPNFTGVQGGSAVFIDRDLNVASLRLYETPHNGKMRPVRAEGYRVDEAPENPLLAKMQACLQTNCREEQPPYWRDFQDAVLQALQLRAREAMEKFFNPAANTGVR